MPKKTIKVSTTQLVAAFAVALIICAGVAIVVWFAKPDRAGVASGGAEQRHTGREHDFPPGTAPWFNLRLPSYTVPVHYDLVLHPDFYDGKSRFNGEVSVDILVKMNTNYLLVHYKQMNVSAVGVFDKTNASVVYTVVDEFAYDQNQFWVVKTKEVIAEGKTITMKLKFDGSLSNGIVGLYKSSYVDSLTNQTKYLATSKFEPVDARKAFPCFDEPNLKATFKIVLVHQPSYTALSNMPVTSTKNQTGTGLMETTFETSVIMSTYLVCFIVCDFGYKEKELSSRKKFRVYATKDKVDQTSYSLDVGASITDYYEDYFGLAYPLPKQDMIAIPDFVSGAMEHWGLITYRETNLLYLEGQSSAANKQRVASVVAHELAHQWFGNIVTMDWWDDLWLNEGFASYVEYVGVDHVERSWNMYGQILVDDVFPVMVADAKISSHPIVVDVKRPEQITEVFDSISYSKGAAVIFMLEAVLNETVFRNGLKGYLNKYLYGNARTDDLWNALSSAAGGGLDVKAFMDTWTRQMGFPVVTVSFDPTEQLLIANQTRFLEDPTVRPPNDSPFGYTWSIPLHYHTSFGEGGLKWLDRSRRTAEIPFNKTNANHWIKFNRGSTGFYRVNYPSELWSRLEKVVKILPVEDRAGLINDALNLARSGYLSYSVALSFIRCLEYETDYVPWITAISALNYVSRSMEARGEQNVWQPFVRSLLKAVYNETVWSQEPKPHLEQLLSESIIRLACGNQHEGCLNKANAYFANFTQGSDVPAGVRRVVYYFAMRSSTEEQWNYMWEAYVRTTANPQERLNLLYGLAQTRNDTLIERYLEYCLDESKIREQDFFTVVTYISGNAHANRKVWLWVQEKWAYLVKRFQIDNRNLGRLVPDIVSGYSTAALLAEVEAFFAKYPDAGAGARGRLTAIETIKSNIAWSNKYVEDIKNVLKNIKTDQSA